MVKFFVFIFLALPGFAAAQIWDFMEVEKLPANINTEAEEVSPLLTPDGKTLYFSRLLYAKNEGGIFSGSDIWVSSGDSKNTWGMASGVSLNDKGNNAVIGINSDGNSIYLLKTTGFGKPYGIHVSRKEGSAWSRPELIPIEEFENTGFLGFYVSPEFDVIFISMKAGDSRGEEDLYVTTRKASGEWGKPINLGSTINTPGYEISPFLTSDKKRLYFASSGHKGLGDADIFYCDRLYNSWDTWTAPRNLGEKLNSKNFDAYFSIYGDTIAYFSSNREGKYSDIFKAKVIPGSEVLAFGQQYLTREEVDKVLGTNVATRITFEKNQVDVSAAQKELLFYIGNKLSLYRDINFHVSIVEEDDPALTNQRLDAIARQLREAGVEALRILATNNGIRKENAPKATFEILLFK